MALIVSRFRGRRFLVTAPCILLSLTSLFQPPPLFWNNGISSLSLADTCPSIVGKGVCVPAFFFQNNFPKPEQSNYHFLRTLTIPLPPYSPDLAPCDFYLFPKLKSKLKGHHFGTMENIQKIITDELNTLTENDFQYCYDRWKKRWNHCVTSQGSYFEGDNL